MAIDEIHGYIVADPSIKPRYDEILAESEYEDNAFWYMLRGFFNFIISMSIFSFIIEGSGKKKKVKKGKKRVMRAVAAGSVFVILLFTMKLIGSLIVGAGVVGLAAMLGLADTSSSGGGRSGS